MRDPFVTTAELVAGAPPMTLVERLNFFTAADRWKGPRLIAYKGFDPRPFHSLPVFYFEAGGWFDTLTGEAWEAPQ